MCAEGGKKGKEKRREKKRKKAEKKGSKSFFLFLFFLSPRAGFFVCSVVIFSSPVQSTGRAIVVTLLSALPLPLPLPFPSRHF